MGYLKKENGVAMVTALMFTLIALAITMTLLYSVLVRTRMSGAEKRYRGAYEASYAAATKLYPRDILPTLIKNFGNYSSAATATTHLASTFSSVGLQVQSSSGCLKQKTSGDPSTWTQCSAEQRTRDPKVSPDLVFNLRSNNTTTNLGFRIYAKIIDNVPGMSDSSGLDLDSGSGVVSFDGNPFVQQQPSLYTFEIQGEREAGSNEKAILEVLYAY